jgi:hypothetical protein
MVSILKHKKKRTTRFIETYKNLHFMYSNKYYLFIFISMKDIPLSIENANITTTETAANTISTMDMTSQESSKAVRARGLLG